MNFFNQFKRSAHSQGGNNSACLPHSDQGLKSNHLPPNLGLVLLRLFEILAGSTRLEHRWNHFKLHLPQKRARDSPGSRVENGAVFSDARIFPISPSRAARARQKVRCALSRVENEYKHLKIMLRFSSPKLSRWNIDSIYSIEQQTERPAWIRAKRMLVWFFHDLPDPPSTKNIFHSSWSTPEQNGRSIFPPSSWLAAAAAVGKIQQKSEEIKMNQLSKYFFTELHHCCKSAQPGVHLSIFHWLCCFYPARVQESWVENFPL